MNKPPPPPPLSPRYAGLRVGEILPAEHILPRSPNGHDVPEHACRPPLLESDVRQWVRTANAKEGDLWGCTCGSVWESDGLSWSVCGWLKTRRYWSRIRRGER